jgi:hypothetical protein
MANISSWSNSGCSALSSHDRKKSSPQRGDNSRNFACGADCLSALRLGNWRGKPPKESRGIAATNLVSRHRCDDTRGNSHAGRDSPDDDDGDGRGEERLAVYSRNSAGISYSALRRRGRRALAELRAKCSLRSLAVITTPALGGVSGRSGYVPRSPCYLNHGFVFRPRCRSHG